MSGAGLAPVRAALDNGLVVLARSTPTTPAVTLHATVRAGARFDPPGAGGLAHFVSRVIDRGTRRRTASALAEALDDRGVTLQPSADLRTLSLTCTCLADDFEAVLDIVADVLRRPVFDAAEVETRRGEIATRIQERDDDPYEVAAGGVMADLYGAGHPYARRVEGTRASVGSIDRDALVRFHEAWFVPSRVSLAVVGDVPAGRAVDLAAAAFGDWSARAEPASALAPPPPVQARRFRRLPMPGKSQAEIAYGFTAVPRSDPSFAACWLMNNVLGQYALGGRLGDRLRERDGMAYYVYSVFEADLIAAPLVIEAGVDPGDVDRALAAIDEEVARLRAEGPTAGEVDDSRRFLVGSLPRMLESNAGIAAFLQLAEFYALGTDYDLRVRGELEAVTRDHVHEAARRFVDPARATIVVAG